MVEFSDYLGSTMMLTFLFIGVTLSRLEGFPCSAATHRRTDARELSTPLRLVMAVFLAQKKVTAYQTPQWL